MLSNLGTARARERISHTSDERGATASNDNDDDDDGANNREQVTKQLPEKRIVGRPRVAFSTPPFGGIAPPRFSSHVQECNGALYQPPFAGRERERAN